MAARNMWRIEINIHEKELYYKLIIYKDYTEIQGQQNLKDLNFTRSDLVASDFTGLNTSTTPV